MFRKQPTKINDDFGAHLLRISLTCKIILCDKRDTNPGPSASLDLKMAALVFRSFLNMGQSRPLFVYFRSFHIAIQIATEKLKH